MLATEQDAVTPGRNADLARAEVIVRGPNFELVSRCELQFSLFKFHEYISRFTLLPELIELSKLCEAIRANLCDYVLELIGVYSIVEVSAPEQHVMLKQVVCFVSPIGKEEAF